jgi:predicted nucleotidyltransferase
MVSENDLRQATERLVRQFRPDRVILFGSQARGSADTHSDVDLLVVCPLDSERPSRRALMVAMDRALAGLGFASDVIVLTPAEFERDRHIPGTVARPAWQEGRVLYPSLRQEGFEPQERLHPPSEEIPREDRSR